MSVMDPDTMTPVPADGETMGELMFRGNITMKGYLKNPTATAQAFAGGWFHSGDLAVMNPDGYVKIKDRSKDIIISGGENISPVEIESILSLHPLVGEVAVAGLKDDRLGQKVVAFIRASGSVDSDTLDQYCRGSDLINFKRPREYVFVKEIPKSPVGKVLRRMLVAGEYERA